MTTRSRYTAAITDKPWWLAGGIPQSACVAAYQAVGASDYASSKINLANPGVYNAIDGAAYPSWVVNTGWTFNGTTQFLSSGIYPTEEMSAIVRFDNTTLPAGNYPTLFGSNQPLRCFYIHVRASNNHHYYVHGSNDAGYPLDVAGNLISGVVAMAKYTAYFNGKVETGTGTPAGWSGVSTVAMPIGKRSDGYFFAGNIQAIAFYSINISQSQVNSLTNAMNAL